VGVRGIPAVGQGIDAACVADGIQMGFVAGQISRQVQLVHGVTGDWAAAILPKVQPAPARIIREPGGRSAPRIVVKSVGRRLLGALLHRRMFYHIKDPDQVNLAELAVSRAATNTDMSGLASIVDLR